MKPFLWKNYTWLILKMGALFTCLNKYFFLNKYIVERLNHAESHKEENKV